MSLIMADDELKTEAEQRPFICHVKRPRDDKASPHADPALCGNIWGAYTVAGAGEVLTTLGFETLCAACEDRHHGTPLRPSEV